MLKAVMLFMIKRGGNKQNYLIIILSHQLDNGILRLDISLVARYIKRTLLITYIILIGGGHAGMLGPRGVEASTGLAACLHLR